MRRQVCQLNSLHTCVLLDTEEFPSGTEAIVLQGSKLIANHVRMVHPDGFIDVAIGPEFAGKSVRVLVVEDPT